MGRYRVKLDTIRCLRPRGAGQYHDTLNVTFFIAPSGHAPANDMKLSSPLGMRGRRMDIHFGPGYSYELVRNDSAFGYGHNFDWELEVDLPRDSNANWEVGIVLWNDRDIDDPYAVTKLITALGLAAASGAAGLALGAGETKTFGAYLAAAAKGMGGESIKKIIGSFFDEWPKCQGLVFNKSLVWNPHNFGENVGTLTLESDRIDQVPEGCHQPHYQVDLKIKDVWEIPQFGTSEQIQKRSYHAVKTPARKQWHGSWYEAMSSPKIGVTIGSATQGGPSDYRVAIREEAPYRNGRRTIVQNTFVPVTEISRHDLYYTGKIVNAKATGLEDVVLGGDLTPRVTRLQKEAASAALWKGAGSVVERSGTASDLLGSVRRPETLEAVWTGGAARTFDDPRRVNIELIEEVVTMAVTEEGATLYIPEYEITLRLYEVEDVMETGAIRRWGPLLRYYRKPRLAATVEDVQLAKYALVR